MNPENERQPSGTSAQTQRCASTKPLGYEQRAQSAAVEGPHTRRSAYAARNGVKAAGSFLPAATLRCC